MQLSELGHCGENENERAAKGITTQALSIANPAFDNMKISYASPQRKLTNWFQGYIIKQ